MSDLTRRSFLRGMLTVGAVTAVPIVAFTSDAVPTPAMAPATKPSAAWFEVDAVNGIDGPLRTGPFRTIAAAMDEANKLSGGTIYLRPGVHWGASDGRALISTPSEFSWPATVPLSYPASCASSTTALAYYL